MTTPAPIILATDLSANAALAARWARDFAAVSGAPIVLAHVVEINVPNWLRGAYSSLDDAAKREALESKVREWFENHCGTQADRVILTAGDPFEALHTIAEDEGAALLVVSRTGKGALSRLVAGSTAQSLASAPPCPVAVVHPDRARLAEGARVALATDLTEASESALSAGARLASMLGTQLTVLHAIGDDQEETIHTQAHERFSAALAAIEGPESVKGMTTGPHLLEGGPVDAVKAWTEREPIDVLVVGNAAKYNVVTSAFRRVSVRLTQSIEATVLVIPPGSDPLATLS